MYVNNLKTLQRLEKEGFITLHAQTGERVYWSGSYVQV